MTIELYQISLLFLFLLPAVWIDQTRHRIPNWLSGALLVGAFVLQGIFGGVSGLGLAGAGMVIGFAVFLGPYALGGMAAGDVKLMAAVGTCLGPLLAFWAACLSLMAGGAIALLLVTHRLYTQADATLETLRAARFPYSSAIASGTAAALVLKETSWII